MLLFRLDVIKSQMSNHITDWVVNISIFNHKRSLEIGALITLHYRPGYYTSCQRLARSTSQQILIFLMYKLVVVTCSAKCSENFSTLLALKPDSILW